MEKTLEDVKQEIIKEILAHTTTVLNTLTNIWTSTFEGDTCISHAEKLVKHVEMLYSDIIEETKHRQECIKTSIDQLHLEASNLKVLLSSDINLTPDTPLYSRQVYLTDCVSILKAEKEKREIKIKMLLEEQKTLCTILDETPRQLHIEPVLPTQNNLIEFRQYLDDLIVEKQARLHEFTKLCNHIDDLLLKLDQYYLVNPGDDTILNEQNPLTKKNLSSLEAFRQHLLSQYKAMRVDIDKMKLKLEGIWNCIGLDDVNFKKQFEVIDYNYGTFNKIALELKKPELHSKIKEKIIAVRQEISDWWNKMFYSESEQAEFLSFTSTSLCQELLLAHETELKRLKEFYCVNEQIFCLLENRRQHLHRLAELDEKSRDPSRFNNRGGQLLQDQRETKSIVRKLNDIGMNIIVLAEEYRQTTNKIFTVNGISVFQVVTEERKQFRGRDSINAYQSRRILTSTALTPNRHGSVVIRRGTWDARRSQFPIPNNIA